jgi:hypothetical protein
MEGGVKTTEKKKLWPLWFKLYSSCSPLPVPYICHVLSIKSLQMCLLNTVNAKDRLGTSEAKKRNRNEKYFLGKNDNFQTVLFNVFPGDVVFLESQPTFHKEMLAWKSNLHK